MRLRTLPVAALAAWVLAVALALLARRELGPPAEFGRAWLRYVAAALLVAPFAWRWSTGEHADADPRRAGSSPKGRRRVFAAALFLLSLALAVVVFRLVDGLPPDRVHTDRESLVVWLAALLAMTTAALVADGVTLSRRLPRPGRGALVEAALVAGVLALALVLRLPQLTQTPPNVHNDEALVGLDARKFLTGEDANLFTVGFGTIPRMSYAIPALSMRVFGDDLFGLRMASVVLGTASVLLTYLLARRLFGVRVALIAGVLLAVAEWHVHFSRSGISYMQAVPVTLLVLLFVVRGSDEGRWLDWVLAGFAVGLSFQVYPAARLAPVLAAGYVVHRAVRDRRFLLARWRGIVVAGLAAVAFFAPMAAFYADHPRAFNERGRQIWIFSPGPRAHAEQLYGVDSIAGVLVEQAKRTLAALNGAGDSGLQYGGVLTDSLAGPLVVLGALVLLTLALRDSRRFLVAVWLLGTLSIAALTGDAPFAPHLIAIIPAFAIAAALFLELGWTAAQRAFGHPGGYAFALLLCAFLALVGYTNYRDYFDRYRSSHPADGPTTLARYATTVDDRYRIYLLPGAPIPLGFETIRFLTPSLDGSELPSSTPLRRALANVPADKGAAFVIALGGQATPAELATTQATYPQARRHRLAASNGYPFFDVFLVDREALLRSRATPSS